MSLNGLIDVNAVMSTMTVNQQSMITLADSSGKVAALATALKGYTVAPNSIKGTSKNPLFVVMYPQGHHRHCNRLKPEQWRDCVANKKLRLTYQLYARRNFLFAPCLA